MADAELEASEVLHSLLSVERVENKSLTSNATAATDIDDSNILWHTPVHGIQSAFMHADGDKLILQSDLSSSCNQDQVCYMHYDYILLTGIVWMYTTCQSEQFHSDYVVFALCPIQKKAKCMFNNISFLGQAARIDRC